MAQAAPVKFTITGLFDKVSDFGHNYTQQTYQILSNAMGGTSFATALLGSMLSLYLIHYGISVWFGQADASPRAIVLRVARVAVIFALATHWAEFQTYVFNLIDQGPDALGEAMLSLNGSSYTSTSGVRGGLQTFWDTSLKLGDKLLANAGYLSWGPYVQATMFFIGVVVFLVIAIGSIMFCKAFIWIMLALAPVVIPLALFPYTLRVALGWITVLLYFFFFQVVVYAYLGFYLSIVDTYNTGISTAVDQAQVTWGTVVPFVLLAYGGVVTMSAIPIVVGMLIGSAGVGPRSLYTGLSRIGSSRRPPPGERPPADANPSLRPPAGGLALSSPANAPLLSPPARQLSAPPLLLQPQSHYQAEVRKLSSQIKNNS